MEHRTVVSIGLDVSDRASAVCAVRRDGSIAWERRVPTVIEPMMAIAAENPEARWILEAGTHSLWLDDGLRNAGADVVVVNPRRLRAVSDSLKKTDRSDAALLALLGLLNPQLLWQVRHRTVQAQMGLVMLKSRDQLVRTRARLITTMRGLVKPFGHRFKACVAEQFHERRDEVPRELASSLEPLFEVLVHVNAQIAALDERIEQAVKADAAASNLTTIPGVGPITALVFTLVIDDPERFKNSRQVGAFLGLTTRIDQSGMVDKQLRITKAGDGMLRRLLVQCAQGMLREKARDTSLKRWATSLVDRGGTAPKKRAAVALARKLAVIMHRMWRDNTPFRAFPEVAMT